MSILTETQQQHQEDLQRLSDLRPIDDDFMRCLFKDNIPLAELVLRIITGKKDFNELPDTYTIFIIEKDFYGKGEPVYQVERINLALGKPFGDGEHILYVNGEYRGESDLGKLMHDFNCTSADDMNFQLMADRTRYLKENPKGVSEMCRIMEDMRNESLKQGIEEGMKEGMREGMKQAALRMLAAGQYALEEIANISGLSLEEVEKLKAGRTA